MERSYTLSPLHGDLALLLGTHMQATYNELCFSELPILLQNQGEGNILNAIPTAVNGHSI